MDTIRTQALRVNKRMHEINEVDAPAIKNQLESSDLTTLNRQFLAMAVHKRTGKGFGQILAQTDTMTPAKAEKIMSALVGQDHILDFIRRIPQIVASLTRKEGSPELSVLLIGPPGVGKTESFIIAMKIHKNGIYEIIPMNEMTDKHAASVFKGASPGLIGYDKGGLICNIVRANPVCGILLDEIDKADWEIRNNVTLKYAETNIITDSRGVTADSTQTQFWETANILEDEIRRGEITPYTDQYIVKDAIKKIRKPFTANEFEWSGPKVDRYDYVLVYSPLSAESRAKIMLNRFGAIQDRIGKEYHYGVELDPTAATHLVDLLPKPAPVHIPDPALVAEAGRAAAEAAKAQSLAAGEDEATAVGKAFAAKEAAIAEASKVEAPKEIEISARAVNQVLSDKLGVEISEVARLGRFKDVNGVDVLLEKGQTFRVAAKDGHFVYSLVHPE